MGYGREGRDEVESYIVGQHVSIRGTWQSAKTHAARIERIYQDGCLLVQSDVKGMLPLKFRGERCLDAPFLIVQDE